MSCARCNDTGEMQVTDPDGYTVGLPCDACELREWIARASRAEQALADLRAVLNRAGFLVRGMEAHQVERTIRLHLACVERSR